MSSMIKEAWRKWLNGHATRGVYDEHPKRVTDLCDGGTDAVSKFEIMAKNKNIALLTRAPLGMKLQTTFYHSVVGVPIKPEDQHFVAMSGKFGRGVEMDPESVFKSTRAVHVPPLVEMMKVKSVEEFVALTPPTRGQKRKVPCYATLVPYLTENIHGTDMSMGEVFLTIVEAIKAKAGGQGMDTPSLVGEDGQGDQGDEVEPGTTDGGGVDEILKKIGSPFEEMLRFVWAAHHQADDTSKPTVSSLQDEDTVQWEIEALEMLVPKEKEPATVDLTGRGDGLVEPTGAITALTKLSESMAKHQEAVVRAQDEKKDPRLKAWNKLPNIQKNVILLGGGWMISVPYRMNQQTSCSLYWDAQTGHK